MKYDKYKDVVVTYGFSIYDFNSVGPLGIIPKRVVFSETTEPNIYNLAFGDLDKNGHIDDYVVTNNRDRDKILATIADIVKSYLEMFPDRIIYFAGSTVERTRLYRMSISINLSELSEIFEIYAIVKNQLFAFTTNINAEAFIIKIKM